MDKYAAKFSMIKRENGDVLVEGRSIQLLSNSSQLEVDGYEIRRNIECDPNIEELVPGEYSVFIAGEWYYEYIYDAEGNKDAELYMTVELIDIEENLDGRQ